MNNDKVEMIELPTDDSSDSPHRWMLTFADLLALLLAFFILMYSMSIITAKQWESMVQSLAHQLNPQFIDDQTEYTTKKAVQRIFEEQAIDLDYLHAILQEKVLQDPVLIRSIELIKHDRKLSILIPGNDLFNNSNSTLTDDAQLILYGVGNVLQGVPNRIEIFANSNEEALQASEYPSHWELSLLRAMVVGEMLKKFGNTSIINAYGRVSPTYGAIEFEGKAHLQALNQTGASGVEIVILNTTKEALNNPGS